jgi:hypothetical protein
VHCGSSEHKVRTFPGSVSRIFHANITAVCTIFTLFTLGFTVHVSSKAVYNGVTRHWQPLRRTVANTFHKSRCELCRGPSVHRLGVTSSTARSPSQLLRAGGDVTTSYGRFIDIAAEQPSARG